MPGDRTTFSPVQRLVISEVLIVAVIAFSFVVFGLFYAQKPEIAEKDMEAVRLNVDVYSAIPVEFQELLTGFGTAQADREVILAAQVTGEIVDINPQLKVGTSVRAAGVVTSPEHPSTRYDGELLLKIDPRDYRRNLEQASHRIAEAKTEIERLKVQQTSVKRQLTKAAMLLNTLKEEYDRIQTAVRRNAASASDLNRSMLEVQRYEDSIIQLESQAAALPHQIAAAEQRLATSESERQRAENDLEKTDVRPPFSGVLSEVMVEKGQFVRTGESLVRLTDLSRVEVPVSLSFDNFLQLEGRLNSGQKPRVLLAENETAEPKWNGVVVRASPEADSVSRTVQVFVEVDNSDSSPLLPGAFVHARIDGNNYNSTLLIPREAIVDGRIYVVDQDHTARRRRIRTGRRLQSMVVVKEGLQPGDRVVMTNLDIIEDGTPLVVQNVSTPQQEIESLRTPFIRLKDASGE
ncbi:MAG: efflux RND transporter periplasmic adaptor subunit [Planctomycetaceae bacterium]